MTAKILGMVVDQCHQFFHQLAQRPMLRELADDDQKARTTSGQNFERPDPMVAHLVASDDLPQTAAFFGVQWFQIEDSELLEERLLCVVQPLEATRGGGEQHDLRL